MSNYIQKTPPMEFIQDVYDIMNGGDNLPPQKLVNDVVSLLHNYLENHPKTLDRQCLELCWAIEGLPTSEGQTEISILASELHDKIKKLITW